MENIAPLLVLIAFMVISGLTKKKRGQGAPKSNPDESQNPQPKPVDLETIFEDFFGKKEGQPQYEEDQMTEEFEEEIIPSREPTAIESAYEGLGKEYGSFESEYTGQNAFEQHLNKTKVDNDYSFSKERLGKLVDYDQQPDFDYDADSKNNESDSNYSVIIEEIDDFALRDAIIYSEIINRKYS